MMLVAVCSSLFYIHSFYLFVLFHFGGGGGLVFVMSALNVQFRVLGDYPYMPQSNWANISETGPQSVSATGDLQRLLCQT